MGILSLYATVSHAFGVGVKVHKMLKISAVATGDAVATAASDSAWRKKCKSICLLPPHHATSWLLSQWLLRNVPAVDTWPIIHFNARHQRRTG